MCEQILEALVADLVCRADSDGPLFVGVDAIAGEMTLVAIPDVDALETLPADLIPPEWDAIGLVATGTAWTVGEDDPDLPPRGPRRVVVAYLVGRDGHEAHRMLGPDGVSTSPPQGGRVPQLLRAALAA